MSNTLICQECFDFFDNHQEYSQHYQSQHSQNLNNNLQNQSIPSLTNQDRALPSSSTQSIDNHQSISASSSSSTVPDGNPTPTLLFTVKSEPTTDTLNSPFEFGQTTNSNNQSINNQSINNQSINNQSINNQSINNPSIKDQSGARINSNIEISVSENQFQCSNCQRSFKRFSFLRVHQSRHRTCSQVFNQNKPKPKPKMKHQPSKFSPRVLNNQKPEKRVPANQSNKSYLKVKKLAQNRETRPCQKPDSQSRQCAECGKSFCTAQYRRVHELIHTDCRPFKCAKGCGARFRQRGHVQVHEASATACARFRLKRKLENRAKAKKRAQLEKRRLLKAQACMRGKKIGKSDLKRGRPKQPLDILLCEKKCGATFVNKHSRSRHYRQTNCKPISHRGTKSKKTPKANPVIQTNKRPIVDERVFCKKLCGASFSHRFNRERHYRDVKCEPMVSPDSERKVPALRITVKNEPNKTNYKLSNSYRCRDCGRRLKSIHYLLKHRSQCVKRAINESLSSIEPNEPSCSTNPFTQDEMLLPTISDDLASKAVDSCHNGIEIEPNNQSVIADIVVTPEEPSTSNPSPETAEKPKKKKEKLTGSREDAQQLCSNRKDWNIFD